MKKRQNAIKNVWTFYEDNILRKHVNNYGTKHWALLKYKLPHRTYKQCRERYVNQLNPLLDRSPFTEDECEIIISLREKIGNKWETIAKHLEGRNGLMVKNFWNSSLGTKVAKRKKKPKVYKVSKETFVTKISKETQTDNFENPKEKSKEKSFEKSFEETPLITYNEFFPDSPLFFSF